MHFQFCRWCLSGGRNRGDNTTNRSFHLGAQAQSKMHGIWARAANKVQGSSRQAQLRQSRVTNWHALDHHSLVPLAGSPFFGSSQSRNESLPVSEGRQNGEGFSFDFTIWLGRRRSCSLVAFSYQWLNNQNCQSSDLIPGDTIIRL